MRGAHCYCEIMFLVYRNVVNFTKASLPPVSVLAEITLRILQHLAKFDLVAWVAMGILLL